ncbi:PREDICTED: cerberus [Nanorana parkeri]|uniref:cerberus n=1 Tax=Nanorana parkeri TaxID=125878 RepID=UPI00085450DC|nr:PREDICTED: cerberus [Nanorana parkeri]
MWFQICWLAIIFYNAANAVGKEQKTNGRANNHSVPTHHHSRKGLEGRQIFVSQDFFVNKEQVQLEASEKNPEENRVAKYSPLPREIHEGKQHSQGEPETFTLRGNKKKSFTSQRFSEKKANMPEEQSAKTFWNYFIYKLNAAPEDFHHPVKTLEIQRQVCKTLPFSQNITHDNCDEVVIQNNLCFGKCNSLHVPNQREELNICSHCRPFKFRMNHLRLNCPGSSNVLKVVMMVEECKCMVYKPRNHGKINTYGHQ